MNKKDILTAEIRNVRLSKRSKKSIREWQKMCKRHKKELRSLCGDTIYDIEAGHWSGPIPSYDFADIKESMEHGYYDFFDIPSYVIVEIDSFDTGILSFEKGVYPKF